MKRSFSLRSFVLSLPSVPPPPPPSLNDGPTVEDFKVTGLKRVDSEVVVRALKSKKGEPLGHRAKVTEDIHAIFATNLFRDVIVKQLRSPTRPGQIILIYDVLEKPSIKAVNIEGNDDVSKDDIRKAIETKVVAPS